MITQTIVKRFHAYQDGECGEKTMRMMRGEQSPPSSAMALGTYFEYLVTGSTGLSEDAPQPITLKNGELSAPYRVCVSQAERVRSMLNQMGVEIFSVNKYEERGDLAGHIDLIAKINGEMAVIDLKYSGNMDDKWNQFGWQWSDKQRDYHSIQAIHYHIITGLPFYYLVTEAAENGDIELFKIEFDDDLISRYKAEIENVRKFIGISNIGVLEARPEFNRCSKCFARDCVFRQTTLTTKQIKL
jgi:hypothetical protein